MAAKQFVLDPARTAAPDNELAALLYAAGRGHSREAGKITNAIAAGIDGTGNGISPYAAVDLGSSESINLDVYDTITDAVRDAQAVADPAAGRLADVAAQWARTTGLQVQPPAAPSVPPPAPAQA
jgi:hypothetical protein